VTRDLTTNVCVSLDQCISPDNTCQSTGDCTSLNNCSGHGCCTSANVCSCLPSYTGPDCSQLSATTTRAKHRRHRW
jgi:hypothetical protein